MNIPGEKFTLDLEDLEQDDAINDNAAPPVMSFVSDIVEKPTICAPTVPALSPSESVPSGFPAHRKRVPKNPSRFKQRAQAAASHTGTRPDERTEREQISEENERRLASMSQQEIEEEQRELMKKLSPGLVEKLLKRATLDDPSEPAPRLSTPEPTHHEPSKPKGIRAPRETFKPDPIPKPSKKLESPDLNYDPDDAAPLIYDESLFPPVGSYHFPTPTLIDSADLDPSSPEFLKSLHEKYFPSLPADPSKLAWMTPVSDREDLSSYHPSQSDVTPSALRFDFRGELLPPRQARELPTHLGLHHHGDAPNAAGYTIPELARLARSSFPTQRCMAMQTLGRILYKLGTGYYEIADVENGLWRCFEEGRVIGGLEEAAGAKGGHMSVKAYATEALWYVPHMVGSRRY
jgi:hypothetical protein